MAYNRTTDNGPHCDLLRMNVSSVQGKTAADNQCQGVGFEAKICSFQPTLIITLSVSAGRTRVGTCVGGRLGTTWARDFILHIAPKLRTDVIGRHHSQNKDLDIYKRPRAVKRSFHTPAGP